MISSVVKTFFAVLCIGCAFSEEVTHMPSFKDVTLAPAIILALKGVNITMDDCRGLTAQAVRRLFETVPRQSHGYSSYSKNILGITPCEKCKVLMNDLESTYITDVAIYEMGEFDKVKSIFIEFPRVHTRCEKCHLTDDDGVEYVGEIYDTWINSEVNIISQREQVSDDGDTSLKIVLLNVTSVEKRKMNCKGVEQFKNICKKGYQTGELDHIFHASMEAFFNGSFDRFEGFKATSIENHYLKFLIRKILMC